MVAKELDLDQFAKAIGVETEPSAWLGIDQDRVNQFADATNDHQYIHVDAERAAASPFGGTIAHGFLTISLVVDLLAEHMLVPAGTETTINYGSDKVRFLAPVRVGQRIRARQEITQVSEKRAGQWLVNRDVVVEIEGSDKPALIAEILLLHIVGDDM
jgi:acyl dehydratase